MKLENYNEQQARREHQTIWNCPKHREPRNSHQPLASTLLKSGLTWHFLSVFQNAMCKDLPISRRYAHSERPTWQVFSFWHELLLNTGGPTRSPYKTAAPSFFKDWLSEEKFHFVIRLSHRHASRRDAHSERPTWQIFQDTILTNPPRAATLLQSVVGRHESSRWNLLIKQFTSRLSHRPASRRSAPPERPTRQGC